MLVRPRSAAARSVNDTKNGIRPNKIPRVDWSTSASRIAWQLVRVDGRDATIRETCARCAAIEKVLIDFDTFFVFRGCAVEDPWRTRAMEESIPRVRRRWRQ